MTTTMPVKTPVKAPTTPKREVKPFNPVKPSEMPEPKN